MEAASDDKQNEGPGNSLAENANIEKSPTPPPQGSLKKSKKEDRLKKDDKNVEQFMKSLNSVPSLEEKLSLVCKKYVQTADDNKKLQFYIKQSDKRHALLLKEKEQLQLEFNKTVLVKSKLENLCRELQKQNKAIKEESLLKIREEEERRKETQAKFQNTLTEITALLQQNNEKNAKLRDDNISMTEKFKSVVQQYQLREQQVDKMAKQMALESQLSDAKLQKASLEHQAEKERMLAEMEQLKVQMAQYMAKIVELQGTESGLRSQLAVYTDKYDEFQNALVKSNAVFGGFKEQMEKMSKKIKKLEKESLSWKKRWETSQSALIEMCTERQTSEERANASARQLHHMQSLCRTLQAERTVLLTTLKDNNIERPPLPTPPPLPPAPPAPAPAPASNAKVDAMAANCAQLRQSLAHLQSQLNVLTNKQQQAPEEPPKQEKKKSKSKKSKDKKNIQEKADVKEDEIKESQQNEIEQVVNEESEVEQDVNKQNLVEQVVNEPNEIENIEEINIQNDLDSDKVDDKTLESLIQAINNANINLCDLEVVDDVNDLDDPNDVLHEILNDVDISNGPKIIELTDEDILKLEIKEKSSNENSEGNSIEVKPENELNKAETSLNKVHTSVNQVESKSIESQVTETSQDNVDTGVKQVEA